MFTAEQVQALETDLESIDAALIYLLQQRIALIGNSQFARGHALSLQQQLQTRQACLKQYDVPEHLWETLVTGCTAAATLQQSQSATLGTARRIAVVGGRGVMGRFFCQRFTAAGHMVKVLERDNWSSAAELLADVDLVLLCVPLHLTEPLAYQVAQYLSPGTALADIASVKAPIVKAMLKAHQGPVMGLHPMFGPGVQSFMAQKVVVCPGRHDATFQWLLDLIEQDGGQLVMASTEEHDQMMVVVQAVRHFSTLCLGVFLARENIDINRSLEFASPIYRMEINMVSRLFAQDTALYADIIMASDDRCQVVQRLVDTYQEIAQLFLGRKRESLLNEFHAAHQVFCLESERAFSESNYLIKNLSDLLIASQLDTRASSQVPIQVSNRPHHEQAA
ncbi:bifunctional chorismate mutase/prephenate dehydrogenase [Lyngbya confervoides]|uniref:Bifunctional chorismate mutase/prephenate dehydrogenase n=1 Tax=Lyngbya confervoides BDU141951 TaxID=1574623 RepID=A0ABD4T8K3_9CYAN|nr:bifunctional chorismate mutase/prephenate dehydrogenase [Lyngbya confervoides]MCM1984907.1 bifunctional chorismate mutase/prephenate dehydrogenase [Lyngbya confervoides BDU141951]